MRLQYAAFWPRSGHSLIVVDNAETLGDVEPLLPNSDGCAVLLATRDLDVATALNAEMLQLGELDEGEALDLLREILGKQRVGDEVETAVELCILCGELPLAVEIAAQRLKSRSRMKLVQIDGGAIERSATAAGSGHQRPCRTGIV